MSEVLSWLWRGVERVARSIGATLAKLFPRPRHGAASVKRDQFSVGNCVSWSSHSASGKTGKKGIVRFVVPAGGVPSLIVRENGRHWKIKYSTSPLPRDHESYLIEVKGPEGHKPRLYWPVVSKLKKIKENAA